MIVIDASAVLEILSGSPIGLQMETAIVHLALHAPELLDLEVANTVRRWEAAGVLRPNEGESLMAVFLAMRITRYPHLPLLTDVWRMRHNLTAYDAAYLALTRHLDAELLTMDEGLKKRSRRR
ncbi:MAG: type II toxin-antitoxin system VapC family toxin [Acidobacteriota bacterium]|nr:type II toxin-antitoxin system VapC family toxin [Acidobacteriota bacterium]